MKLASSMPRWALSILILLLVPWAVTSAEPPTELHGEWTDLVIKGYIKIGGGRSDEDVDTKAQQLGATHYAWGTHYVEKGTPEYDDAPAVDTSAGYARVTPGVVSVEYKWVPRRHIDFYRYAPREAMKQAFEEVFLGRLDPKIVRGWLQADFDPNSQDTDGLTMLHWLALAANVRDPVGLKSVGPDPLFSTRGARMEEIAQMLLEVGADPAVRGGARNGIPVEILRSIASQSEPLVPHFTLQRIISWLDPETSSTAQVEQHLVLDVGRTVGRWVDGRYVQVPIEIVIDLDEEGSPQHAAEVRRMAESGELDGRHLNAGGNRGFSAPSKVYRDGAAVDPLVIEHEKLLSGWSQEGAVVGVRSEHAADEGVEGLSTAMFYIFEREQRWATQTPHTRIGTVVRNLEHVISSGGWIKSARMVGADEL